MFKSIFAKYIVTFMCIILVSFLVLTGIITITVNRYALDGKMDNLQIASDTAADYLGSVAGKLSDDKDAFSRAVTGHTRDVDRILLSMTKLGDDVTMLVVDKEGNILRAARDGKAQNFDAKIDRTVLKDVNAGSGTADSMELPGVFDSPCYFSATPVTTSEGAGVCGTVFACADSAKLTDLLADMIKTVVIGSLWIMMAALVAVYLITEKVIGPLRDMSNMAKSFAAGNFDARVPVRGRDEVADLAVAFNNMADSLSRLEVMRNTFMANVSHDLRTPMTTISGFIDNILSGAIPPEKQPSYLSLIKTEVQRLARLVASLLDISRIQAGDRKFEMKPFDICEMARLILISFEAKIEAKKLDVSFECDEERMIAEADRDAIYQILYNICDNAVKFSREGGRLAVSLTGGEVITVSVYNEGIGIPAEDLPFVFERFYKGDKSRGLDKTGVGLGMFIAKTIMDAHKQKIWVESVQNEYCRFSFTLPCPSSSGSMGGKEPYGAKRESRNEKN